MTEILGKVQKMDRKAAGRKWGFILRKHYGIIYKLRRIPLGSFRLGVRPPAGAL